MRISRNSTIWKVLDQYAELAGESQPIDPDGLSPARIEKLSYFKDRALYTWKLLVLNMDIYICGSCISNLNITSDTLIYPD